jgi:hypothetical protein
MVVQAKASTPALETIAMEGEEKSAIAGAENPRKSAATAQSFLKIDITAFPLR